MIYATMKCADSLPNNEIRLHGDYESEIRNTKGYPYVLTKRKNKNVGKSLSFFPKWANLYF